MLLAGAALLRSPNAAARLRNAWMLRRGGEHDFAWTPDHLPRGFHVARGAAPTELAAVARRVAGEGGDWPRALALAAHLVEHAAERGPIRADLVTTYRGVREGFGYCADYVKVYLALAQASGLFARQWSFSFDGFGGSGHTFVEIYDRERREWRFLDVFNNVHAVDPSTGSPLSALAFRAALVEGRAQGMLQPNGPGRLGFVIPDKALDYYRRGTNEWYLWWGNDVAAFYATPRNGRVARWRGALAHLRGNLVAVRCRARILPTAHNGAACARLARTRRMSALTLVAGGAALALAAHVWLAPAGARA